MKPGAVKLAQLTGCPIGIFYAHPEKAWVLRSWDRFLIPKPFSRVAISWARNVEVPQTRDALCRQVFNREWSPYDRSLDGIIVKLRRKLEPNPDNPLVIKTVRGRGYVFTGFLK